VRDALRSMVGDVTEDGGDIPPIQVLFIGDLIPTQIRAIAVRRPIVVCAPRRCQALALAAVVMVMVAVVVVGRSRKGVVETIGGGL
jgi:hypothetical protein